MIPNPPPLGEQIDAHHGEMEEAEQNAVAIDERLRAVPGIESYLKTPRPYGSVRNPWAAGNATAQALVMRADRPLAVWLASKAGKQLPAVDYAAQAAKESMEQQQQALLEKTHELRQQRLARDQRRAHERLHGSWNPHYGKVI